MCTKCIKVELGARKTFNLTTVTCQPSNVAQMNLDFIIVWCGQVLGVRVHFIFTIDFHNFGQKLLTFSVSIISSSGNK